MVVAADRKLAQVFYLLCLNFGQRTNKVITMQMLGRIRRMYLRDKLSPHEITKRTGLSRNTIRRWLRTPEEVKTPTYTRAAGFGKLSGFTAELEQSLKADALRPKQSRRTGRALFVQIKASGYLGSCIRAWRVDANAFSGRRWAWSSASMG